MTHKNDMRAWDEIACQRGHTEHISRKVHVDLSKRHGYRDLPQVPRHMAVEFDMNIWDTSIYPVDGSAFYCPSHDAVSETILSHGIWEPRETIVALHAFQNAPEGSVFYDMGAQMGWFTLLAGACGVPVEAWECDKDNLRLLWENWKLNRGGSLTSDFGRIGPESKVLEPDRRICLAKIDLEGAERDAIRMLWPSIEAGLVDRLLIEISPCFDSYYGDLVLDLLDAGYAAYRLPEKGQAVGHGDFDGSERSLAAWHLDEMLIDIPRWIAGLWQEDLVFIRQGS